MRVIVEYQMDGSHKIVRLQEVDFVPRIGETIAIAGIEGDLVVESVIHGFSPDYRDHLIRLKAKFVTSPQCAVDAWKEFYNKF